MMLSTITIQPLNSAVPDGLFVGAGGCPYWVFSSSRGRVALQLDATAVRPAFSFDWLDRTPAAMGVWIGSATPRIGRPATSAFRGCGGLIVQRADRWYVKAATGSGGSERLMLSEYHAAVATPHSIIYADWQLELVLPAGRVPVFKCGDDPPRLRAYPSRDAQAFPRVPLRLVDGSELRQ